eukprot:726383_1
MVDYLRVSKITNYVVNVVYALLSVILSGIGTFGIVFCISETGPKWMLKNNLELVPQAIGAYFALAAVILGFVGVCKASKNWIIGQIVLNTLAVVCVCVSWGVADPNTGLEDGVANTHILINHLTMLPIPLIPIPFSGWYYYLVNQEDGGQQQNQGEDGEQQQNQAEDGEQQQNQAGDGEQQQNQAEDGEQQQNQAGDGEQQQNQ